MNLSYDSRELEKRRNARYRNLQPKGSQVSQPVRRIIKLGSSLALTLPSGVCRDLLLYRGDLVMVEKSGPDSFSIKILRRLGVDPSKSSNNQILASKIGL